MNIMGKVTLQPATCDREETVDVVECQQAAQTSLCVYVRELYSEVFRGPLCSAAVIKVI